MGDRITHAMRTPCAAARRCPAPAPPVRRRAGSPWLALQRTIGNAAVGRLLAGTRSAATPFIQRDAAPDPPALASPLLAASARLQQAYHNQPSLHMRETGEGVKALQRALVETGFGHLLTKSMKGGEPDGVYGDETFNAVHAFQAAHGVRPVGGAEAGHKTLLALDRALGAGPPPDPAKDAADRADVPTKVTAVQEPGSKTDNDEVVQEPKPKVTPTDASAHKVEDDGKLSGNIVINVGGSVQWNTAKAEPPKGPDHPKDFDPLCEHGVLQLGGKVNVPWAFNPASRKLKYVPEFELDVDFAPKFCNRMPSLSLQVTALKLQLSDTFEFVLNATAGTQGPPRGWFAQGAVELDIHPFRSGFLKPLEIDGQFNGGGLLIPQSFPGHDFKTGTFGSQVVLKYTF